MTAAPNVIAAAAARVRFTPDARTLASDVVTEYLIGPHDLATIYMSPDPYGQAFEQEIDLRKWDLTTHCTAGMRLLEKNGRLLLASIDASTPAARIARWRTHLRGAWLVSINGTPVESVHANSPHQCILVFSHPET